MSDFFIPPPEPAIPDILRGGTAQAIPDILTGPARSPIPPDRFRSQIEQILAAELANTPTGPQQTIAEQLAPAVGRSTRQTTLPASQVANNLVRPGALTAETAATPQAGRIAALLSRTPGASTGAAGGGMFGPGSLGRAGGYFLGGQVAGSLIDSVVGERNGPWDDFASDAARYGGAGAALGSLIPIPGVSTLTGGLLGVGVAAFQNFLGTSAQDSPAKELSDELGTLNTRLTKALSVSNLTADESRDVMGQIALPLALAGTKDEARAVFAQATAALPQLIAQAKIDSETRRTEEQSAYRYAALASMLGPQLQEQQNLRNLAAAQYSQLANNAAGAVQDPAMRSILQTSASRAPLDAAAGNADMIRQILYGAQSQSPQLAGAAA